VAYTEPNDQKSPARPTGKTDDPLNSGQLKRVDAFGNVEVRTIADIVRGDKGIYIPETGQGRVVGHARITHGENQINGPAADFNMKTGVARIVAQAGSRVEGLLVPRAANGDKANGNDAVGTKPTQPQ
jgi:lipopolysaccharide export system protein LptA